MSGLAVFSVGTQFGVCERFNRIESFFAPSFWTETEAVLFRDWLGRWRATRDDYPSEDEQIRCSVMIHLFLEPIIGISVSDVLTDAEMLTAFLDSSYAKAGRLAA